MAQLGGTGLAHESKIFPWWAEVLPKPRASDELCVL
jgi:hypothetical protein